MLLQYGCLESAVLPSCEDLLTLDTVCSKTVCYWSNGKDRRSDWFKHSHSQGQQGRRAKHAPDKTSFRREKYDFVAKCSIKVQHMQLRHISRTQFFIQRLEVLTTKYKLN